MTSRHMASGQLPPRRSCTGDDRDGARRGFALGRGDSGGVGFRPCGCRGGRSHDEPTCSRSSDRPIEVELAYKVSLASLSQINAKPLFPSPLRRRGLLPARWTPHSAGSGWFSNSKGPAGAERRVPLCRSAGGGAASAERVCPCAGSPGRAHPPRRVPSCAPAPPVSPSHPNRVSVTPPAGPARDFDGRGASGAQDVAMPTEWHASDRTPILRS